jgi:peptide/nickel transport system permease protein
MAQASPKDASLSEIQEQFRSRGGSAIHRGLRHWLSRNAIGVLSCCALIAAVVAAVAAPIITPIDPTVTSLIDRLKPPGTIIDDVIHPLGTDQLGRDILSRLLYGARISLFVGIMATTISALTGVLLGLLAGYYQGTVDDAVMRICDAQMSIPFLVLAISVVAVLGPGLANTILCLGFAGWTAFARLVRAETLAVGGRDYVLAARAIGAPDLRVLLRHVLPNTTSSIIVMSTFHFAQMIISEASLSFLGLGVPPPTPSWGTMIDDGRGYLQIAWWLTTVPGIAMVLLVLASNTFGDWLRDRLDPHLQSID